MSTPGTRRWHILRIPIILASVLILALIAAEAGVQVDQILLRKRAEQLLADVRLLQVRRTTLAEAEQLLHRWDSETKRNGDCSRKCGNQQNQNRETGSSGDRRDRKQKLTTDQH